MRSQHRPVVTSGRLKQSLIFTNRLLFVSLPVLLRGHMIFEVTFWIAFIAVSRMITKSYDRRRDVLYGPYRANRGRSRIDG